MKTMIRKKAPVLLLASALLIGASASAATIYNNLVSDSNYRFGPRTQFGDEIIFAGTQRVLTGFSFNFWALNNGGLELNNFGPVSVQVWFYRNNGPLTPTGFATPNTSAPIWASAVVPLNNPTARSTLSFSALDFPLGVPLNLAAGGPISNMTWTVQFTGMDLDDAAGLDVFNPPTVGTSPAKQISQNTRLDDYWELNSGTWNLKTNSFNNVGIDMNFAASFEAIPEPSTVAFGVLGGLGLLVFGRRFIKASK